MVALRILGSVCSHAAALMRTRVCRGILIMVAEADSRAGAMLMPFTFKCVPRTRCRVLTSLLLCACSLQGNDPALRSIARRRPPPSRATRPPAAPAQKCRAASEADVIATGCNLSGGVSTILRHPTGA